MFEICQKIRHEERGPPNLATRLLGGVRNPKSYHTPDATRPTNYFIVTTYFYDAIKIEKTKTCESK